MTSDVLADHRIAITGRLSSMTRDDAAEAIAARGGTFVRSVSRRTDLLVLGQEGSPLAKDGGLTVTLRRARELIEDGHPLEILTEDQFLAALGREREQRLYTLAQLSRILGVPGARLRSWVRKGLIRPARTANRLSYFEFQGVSAAKAVADLVQAQVTPERIRVSLAELARWIPAVESRSLEMALETMGSELVVRLDDGTVAETDGQFRFDFDQSAPPAAIPVAVAEPTAEAALERGVDFEDAGDPAAAARAYERAIRADPGLAEARFNLGNVLYEIGRPEVAAQRFLEAVELDASYVEAWNNLGNTMSDLDKPQQAVSAFERALAIEPLYADAHYNLAETLLHLGRSEPARRHWRAYLAQDPASPWADRVRRRLRE